MRRSPGAVAAGLLLSVALSGGVARASDPGEQLMLERADFWRAQHRLDLVRDILDKLLALNPDQADALYQRGMLALQQGDRGSAGQYFDRLRLLAPADRRAAELVSAAAPQPPVPAAVPVPHPAPSPEPPAVVLAAAPAPVPAAKPTVPAAPPPFVVASADSPDLIPVAPPAAGSTLAASDVGGPDVVAVAADAPRRRPVPPVTLAAAAQAYQIAALPAVTPTDTDAASALAAVQPAGSADVGIVARQVQVAQVELQPPMPVGGYQPLGTLKPYSASDTLETYIERDLARLEAQTNPTLVAGLGYRTHSGTEGLNSLDEAGGSFQASFSPWYTGTATITVLPVYLDAGTPANGNLGLFGANPILRAAGLAANPAGDQNATGVGLLGSYSLGDFSGQFGTTPIGFAVTNFVGDLAYDPKFLDGMMSVRFEGLRQPVTDSVLSYAGTHASFARTGTIAPGAFGSNTTWGGVVKTGPHVSVFYDNQNWGAYGGVGYDFLTGTNVAQNDELSALLGTYFRPLKLDYLTLRVGVSVFFASFGKNLSGFSFGQGGYFSPQDFEGLGFPVEVTGHTGRWSYLASSTIGVQHFRADSSQVFPNNPNAQADLQALSPSSAFVTSTHATGLGYNLKGQVEYALDKTTSLGLAGTVNNGNNYEEGIVQLYLRKTFDWFAPVAIKDDDPEAIAARDLPASRL